MSFDALGSLPLGSIFDVAPQLGAHYVYVVPFENRIYFISLEETSEERITYIFSENRIFIIPPAVIEERIFFVPFETRVSTIAHD